MNRMNDLMLQITASFAQFPQGGGANETTKDDFSQLLQQTQGAQNNPQKPAKEQNAVKGDKPQKEQPAGQEAPSDTDAAMTLHKQQLLAAQAMAIVQVPAEEAAQAAPEIAIAAAPVAAAVQPAETAQTNVMPDSATPQMPAEQAADTPVASDTAATPETQAQQPAQAVQPQRQTAETDLHSAQPQDEDAVVTGEGAPVQDAALFKDVQAAPVKVGAPVVHTEAPDVDVQLANQVETALQNGDTRVQIKLTPENLGTVTVQLTRSTDGSLHIELQASTARAATVLEKHSSGLESLLMGSNQNSSVRVDVPRPQEGQQSQQHAFNQERGGQGGQNRQQEQRQQQPERDFLQELRLGLVELS